MPIRVILFSLTNRRAGLNSSKIFDQSNGPKTNLFAYFQPIGASHMESFGTLSEALYVLLRIFHQLSKFSKKLGN